MRLLPRLAVPAIALAVVALPPAAQAHRQWMIPSASVLSGADPWITVDAAVSNDLFVFEHVPMRLDGVTITAPDGSKVEPKNPSTGKFRSTFDVQLTQQGTYRVSSGGEMASASWKEGTETKRWRGPVAQLATAIPAGAAEPKMTVSSRRLEFYVTRGAPTRDILKPTGQGLELDPETHPNDLVASEPAKFKFLMDGKPAANLELEVVAGGQRYRSTGGDWKVTTGADGVANIKWPGPGMYWLEASTRGGQSPAPGAERQAVYIATFEVLPD